MTESIEIMVGDEANFQDVVISRSHQTPVLVDFWADWCAPCKVLMPVLESVVNSFGGKVALVKVNTDEQQALAQSFGIRSLPTVKLFKQGAVVAEFMGAQPESEIRAIIEPHIERASDELCTQAIAAREAGELDQAVALLNQAVTDDPENLRLYPELLEVCLARDDLEAANAILAALPRGVDEDRIDALRARLRVANQAAGGNTDEEALRTSLAENPENHDARFELSTALAGQARYEEALDELLAILRKKRNYNEGAARQSILDIFQLLGNTGPVVSRYRSQLASTLN
jgi:putative thioredoxin